MFVDQDSYIESFEMACQLHTLKQQVTEFVVEEALKAESIIDQSTEIDARADLLLDPNTTYAERFEAAIQDMLLGRHISQTEIDTPGLQRKPQQDEEIPHLIIKLLILIKGLFIICHAELSTPIATSI